MWTPSFNTAEGVSLSEATQIVERAKRELGMPSGIPREFRRDSTGCASFLDDDAVLFPAAKIDHHDRILFYNPDEQDDPDDRHEIEFVFGKSMVRSAPVPPKVSLKES